MIGHREALPQPCAPDLVDAMQMLGIKLDQIADLRPEEAGGGPLTGEQDRIVTPAALFPLLGDEVARIIAQLDRPAHGPAEIDMMRHQEEIDAERGDRIGKKAAHACQAFRLADCTGKLPYACEGVRGWLGSHDIKQNLRTILSNSSTRFIQQASARAERPTHFPRHASKSALARPRPKSGSHGLAKRSTVARKGARKHGRPNCPSAASDRGELLFSRRL
jgi:hypothetical protein